MFENFQYKWYREKVYDSFISNIAPFILLFAVIAIVGAWVTIEEKKEQSKPKHYTEQEEYPSSSSCDDNPYMGSIDGC